MSWFNILMSNYKTDTSSKVSFKPVPNQTFLFNCFGLTKGIWRFRGEYKYCNKKKKMILCLLIVFLRLPLFTVCFSISFFFLFSYFRFSLYYFSSSPFLGTILWQQWKISAADVQRRGKCVYYSIRTERFGDVTRNCSVQARNLYILWLSCLSLRLLVIPNY